MVRGYIPGMETMRKPVEELSGRELDAAVAEEVMGWARTSSGPRVSDDRYPNFVSLEEGIWVFWAPGTAGIEYSPSTDIASAVEALGPLRELFPDQTVIVVGDDRGWGVCSAARHPSVIEVDEEYGSAETLPEAICRAALAAVRGKR